MFKAPFGQKTKAPLFYPPLKPLTHSPQDGIKPLTSLAMPAAGKAQTAGQGDLLQQVMKNFKAGTLGKRDRPETRLDQANQLEGAGPSRRQRQEPQPEELSLLQQLGGLPKNDSYLARNPLFKPAGAHQSRLKASDDEFKQPFVPKTPGQQQQLLLSLLSSQLQSSEAAGDPTRELHLSLLEQILGPAAAGSRSPLEQMLETDPMHNQGLMEQHPQEEEQPQQAAEEPEEVHQEKPNEEEEALGLAAPMVCQSFKSGPPQSSDELKFDILTQLPGIIAHQQICKANSKACQLNTKLLQYFIRKEFIDNNPQMQEIDEARRVRQEGRHSEENEEEQPKQEFSHNYEISSQNSSPNLFKDIDLEQYGIRIQKKNRDPSKKKVSIVPKALSVKKEFEVPLPKVNPLDEMFSGSFQNFDSNASRQEAPQKQEEPQAVQPALPVEASPAMVQFQQPETTKQVMKITRCPHTNRKHYAKNMCSSCYRKYGRNQNAWNCPHKDRLLYSMGMCQTCYLSDYHKRKSQENEKFEQQEEQRKSMVVLEKPDEE